MSAALQLDFVRPPRHRWRWLGWLALVLAALGCAGLADERQRVSTQLEALQRKNELLLARARPAGTTRAAAPPDALVLRGLQRANVVIDQLAVPWPALFAALEGVPTRGVQLRQLVPEAQARSLRLGGEAPTLGAVLAYVERLAAQPGLEQVHLTGFETVAREGAASVGFSLSASWRPL